MCICGLDVESPNHVFLSMALTHQWKEQSHSLNLPITDGGGGYGDFKILNNEGVEKIYMSMSG